MKNKNYLLIILCLVLVIANHNDFDIFSRISLGSVGICLILDIIEKVRGFQNERD